MRRTALFLLQVSLLTLVVSTNADIWTFFNPMSLKQDVNQNQQVLLSTSPAYPPAEAPSLHHHHHHNAHHPNPLPHTPLTQPHPPAKSPMMPPPGHHHHHHQPLPHTPLSQPHPPAKSPMMPPPGHHKPLPHTPLSQPHPPVKSPMMPPPGHHHHHHKHHMPPPMMAPSHPPTMPPRAMPPMTMPPHGKPSMKPPTKAPGHQPVKAPPRMLVAVQGVVYCKSCNSSGVSTLLGASPLEGVRVVMKCRNTVYTTKVIVLTDKNGYFMIQPPKTVTNYGVHKCRVALASPPLKSPCKKPTMLNDGLLGSVPVPQLLGSKKNESSHHNFAMYKVGPFAYEHLKGHCPPKQ